MAGRKPSLNPKIQRNIYTTESQWRRVLELADRAGLPAATVAVRLMSIGLEAVEAGTVTLLEPANVDD